MELWKDIPGYPGYKASDAGRIKSLPKKVKTTGGHRIIPGRIMALRPDSQDRYLIVDLQVAGRKVTKLVHRLIGIAFLDLKDGQEINHKRGDTKDNRISEIEVTTRSGNELHKYRVLHGNHPCAGRKGKKHPRSKSIEKYDLVNGLKIAIYESGRLAELDGYQSSCISLCCQGKQNSHAGFGWRYKTSDGY